MRCPKCGYISYDHLENCVKCNKDITEVSSSLFGSTYKVPAPNFLKLPREKKEDLSEKVDLIEESVDEVEEYLDEDLDILIEDDEPDTDGEIRFADSETEIELKSSEPDQQEDQEGEIEIDFSRFEDDDEPEVNLFDDDDAEEEEQQEPAVRSLPARELPDELSDMSDLAHPGKSPEPERPAEKSSSSDLSDLELDDLFFDLGLDDLDEDPPAKKGESEESILSLDDIDFSDALADGSSNKKSGSMDEDLDFDLDLGGLSIHKDV